ncbi:hypothetical protein HG426_003675 [Candidatus Saccharibacteria bacterium]|nr:hypothetical protein [Candidatus Saccharibacteria bacterium]
MVKRKNISKSANKLHIKSRKIWQVVLIVLSSIAVVMTAVYIIGGIIVDREINKRSVSDRTEQANITNYLRNKYDQDFEVEKPSCNGGGLGVSCVWSTDAYPKSDKSIKIHVSRVDNQTKYSDNYVVRTWQKEQTAKIQPKAREIFKDMPVDVKIRLGVIDSNIESTFTLKKPTFEEVFLTENKVGQRGNLVYGLYFKYNGDIKEANRFANSIYEMTDYIKNMGVSLKDISVNIYLSKGDKLVSKGYCNSDKLLSIDGLKSCIDTTKNTPVEEGDRW